MDVDPQEKCRGDPLPSLHSLLSPPFPSEVGPLNPARGLGSSVSSPKAGCGAEPQPKYNLVHFWLKSDIWWQRFYNFPENQLTKFNEN